MSDRERLLVLVGQVQDGGYDVTDVVEVSYIKNESLVDFLISSGVRVKENERWIPVAEKLPEDFLPKGRKQIKVLTAIRADNGVYTVRSQLRFLCGWSRPRWEWKYSAGEVTHWRYLPEPPKSM